MDLSATTATLLDRSETALRAYLAWQADGRPHGRDLDYWLAAEKQVLRLRAARPTAPETLASAPRQAISKSKSKASKTGGLGLRFLGAD
jgi:hypothetical protein